MKDQGRRMTIGDSVSAKILVVENEPIVALDLQDLLQKLHYDVVGISTTGADALGKISNLRPEIVLMDIQLDGGMDGIETAVRIPREFDIPVLYLTAFAQDETLERARATKPYGFIVKPITERELHATIQMALVRHRADLVVRDSEQRLARLNLELATEIGERKRFEEALVKSEEDMRNFFELSPLWPWTSGPDGVVGSIPQKLADTLGMSVAEVVDGGWRARNHPEDRNRIDAAWGHSVQTGEPYDQEMRTLLPDDNYHWFRVRAFPRLDESGNVVRWYGSIENVHARKLAELALQASEEEMRNFIELSPQAPWVAMPDGTQVSVNSRFDQEVSTPLGVDRFSDWEAMMPREDFARVMASWDEAIRTRTPFDVEIRLEAKTGGYRWFRSRSFPKFDESGEIARWYGVLEDVHDRKLTQISLQESEERFRRIYNESPLGILLVRAVDARILDINPAGAKFLEYTPSELIGRSLDGIALQDEPGTPTGQPLTEERRWQSLERRYATKSGKIITTRVRACRLPHIEGQPEQILGLLEDITGQRQIELALIQSQKMEAIGTLTGGMAHDFNNLLGIIIGNLDLLREIRPDDAELTDLGGEALDAAMRGAELTRSLLAFARRQPLQPRRLDLDIVIGGQMRLLSRLLGEDIETKLDFAEDICAIIADPAQLEAALTNLATNARAAMPRGGRLTIATSYRRLDAEYAAANPDVSPGDYAMIEFTDTGEGMPPDVRERIFEPFFTTKNERGTGLGLSMVFGFMKQSGGHVSAYSEIGVGTTFRLYFPCSQAPGEKEIDLRPDGPLSGNGETVLAVEDNTPLRRIVVRQLLALGYRVLEAGDGAQALAILETENVDLLFTDVVMPGGMDGFELADTAGRRQPGIKILLTSGFPQTRYIDEMRKRAFPLLSKPYRKGNLAQLVRAVLDGREGPANS
jgi:PAS domain S-box-containing protein